jgi:hypothetical protein
MNDIKLRYAWRCSSHFCLLLCAGTDYGSPKTDLSRDVSVCGFKNSPLNVTGGDLKIDCKQGEGDCCLVLSPLRKSISDTHHINK